MLKVSDNLIFWIEDFDRGRRLCYGYFDPDNISDDKDYFLSFQAEYFKDKVNLSVMQKFHIKEENCYDGENILNQHEDLLFKYEYKQDLVKPYLQRFKPSKSCIYIKEITSNNPQEVAIFNGCLMIAPLKYDKFEIVKFIGSIFEKYKYESINTEDFSLMFDEIINSFPGSSIVTDLGVHVDGRVFKNKPKGIAIICSQNIYGELAKN